MGYIGIGLLYINHHHVFWLQDTRRALLLCICFEWECGDGDGMEAMMTVRIGWHACMHTCSASKKKAFSSSARQGQLEASRYERLADVISCVCTIGEA